MSRAAAVLALAAALALAGCASGPALRAGAPTAPPVPAPAAAAVTPAPTPARAAPGAATIASPDTVPSADALAVLAGIPEPLGAEARGASPSAPASPEPEDAAGQADVPVPARTPVLGERPLPEIVAPADTTTTPPAAVPPVSAPVAAAPDTCWRVQFAAWADRGQAERYLDAARSQLAVPLAIEKAAGLFKVRTTGCLDGAAADALRRRAREAGFDGAFRFRGGKP